MERDDSQLRPEHVEREVREVGDSLNALIGSLDPDKRPLARPFGVRAHWDDSKDPEPPPWTGEWGDKPDYSRP